MSVKELLADGRLYRVAARIVKGRAEARQEAFEAAVKVQEDNAFVAAAAARLGVY